MYKLRFFLLIFCISILSCQQDLIIENKKEKGAITGQIFPNDSKAIVELHQGPLLRTSNADNNGYFYFDDLKIGYYSIKAYANDLGSVEKDRIHVAEGEVTDIGTLTLTHSNSLISRVEPYNNQMKVKTTQRIRLTFNEDMDFESVKNAFSIVPPVDYSFTADNYSYYYFYISASLDFETMYTIHLDTTARSISGKYLEYQFSSTFTTDRFRVDTFNPGNSLLAGDNPIYIYFTGEIKTDQSFNSISITPEIDMLIRNYDDGRLIVNPTACWKSDTLFELSVLKGIQSENGTTTQTDTSFIFRTCKLAIVNTVPYNGQNFIPSTEEINIRFNYIIDESTILKSLQVSPALEYKIITSRSGGYSNLRIDPDSLQLETQYEITISEELKDNSGKNLSSDYSFNFTTANY